MNAIEVINLSKSYDGVQKAVNNMRFSISKGNIFGCLGPNGAGKTTLVRLLNGILAPTEGSGEIYGKDILKESKSIHRICGVMTENAGNYENLNALENLVFFGKMYGMSFPEIQSRSAFLLDEFKLGDAKEKKVKHFSTGMKKRLSLARTLIHSPKVLFLDEPTSGLDPESSKLVLDLIKKMAIEQDVTVFLCTHQLKYAEEICSLYGFIDKGDLLGFGTFQELLTKKEQNLYLDIKGRNIAGIETMEKRGEGQYRIPVQTEEQIPLLLDRIIDQGGKIYEAKQAHWDLEDLYFAYQRGDRNE